MGYLGGLTFIEFGNMELKKEASESLPLLRGDSGSRTHDLQIANLSLYQLSYIPIIGWWAEYS